MEVTGSKNVSQASEYSQYSSFVGSVLHEKVTLSLDIAIRNVCGAKRKQCALPMTGRTKVVYWMGF